MKITANNGLDYTFTRIDCDYNGNPRFIIEPKEFGIEDYPRLTSAGLYKYRGKDDPGTYYTSSYNLQDDIEFILSELEKMGIKRELSPEDKENKINYKWGSVKIDFDNSISNLRNAQTLLEPKFNKVNFSIKQEFKDYYFSIERVRKEDAENPLHILKFNYLIEESEIQTVEQILTIETRLQYIFILILLDLNKKEVAK